MENTPTFDEFIATMGYEFKEEHNPTSSRIHYLYHNGKKIKSLIDQDAEFKRLYKLYIQQYDN